jgi:hypothetical protein
VTYQVQLAPAAKRQIKKLDSATKKRVLDALGKLATDPRPLICRMSQAIAFPNNTMLERAITLGNCEGDFPMGRLRQRIGVSVKGDRIKEMQEAIALSLRE